MKFKVLGAIACFATCFFTINYWSQVSFEIVKKEHRSLLQQLAIKQAIQIERSLKLVTNNHQWLMFELHQGKDSDIEKLAPLAQYMMEQIPEITSIDLSPNSVTSWTVPRDPARLGHLIVPPSSRASRRDLHTPFYEPPYLDSKQRSLLIKHLPVFIDNMFWGYISYTLNLNLLFAHSQLDQLNTRQFNYQLVHTNKYKKESILVQNSAPLNHQIYVASINLPNANLLLKLSPTSRSYATNVIMNIVFSLSIASIFTLISYLGLTEPTRLRAKLNRTVSELEDLQLTLTSIVDNISDEVIYTDTTGKVILHNIKARETTHAPSNITFSDQQIHTNNPLFEYDGKTVIEPAQHPINRTLYNDELVTQEVMLISFEQEAKRLEMTSFPVKNSVKTIGALCIGQPLGSPNQTLIGDLSRTAILEMLEKNQSLEDVFEYTIKMTQSIVKDTIVAISLIDTKSNQISQIFSSDLPSFYRRAIVGTPITQRLMSSNSAIAQNKLIVVEDINVHPYWTNEKELANQADLRACWSQPFHDHEGHPIGSLDFYSVNILHAAPATIVILKETALLVGLTLERHQDIYRLNKMSLAVQHTSSAVTIINAQGIIEYINPKYCAVTGYQPVDLIGTTSPLFSAGQQHSIINGDIMSTVNHGQAWSGEVSGLTKSGECYWSNVTVTPILDEHKETTQIVISQENITYIAPDNIDSDNYQKSIDALTGLYTQYAFVQQLDRLLNQPGNNFNIHCLCNLNIDQYQDITQKLGTNAGDELLRQVGQLLNQTVRRRDTVARLSADQFVILMEDCHWQPASKSLQKLVKNIESYSFSWRNNNFDITLSIGLTEMESGKKNSEICLQEADIACLKAKDSNKTIIRYQQDIHDNLSTKGDLYWSQKIRHALAQDSFLLYVQPIKQLVGQQTRPYYEVLLRLPVDSGFVLPTTFLPAASRYHLSISIDKWVIENTIKWIKQNIDSNPPRFSINLSAATLQDHSFGLYLLQLSEDHNNAFEYLSFEFSEYLYTSHTASCRQLIDALHHTKCQFTIDNFGQGFSSFNLLRDANVSAIKISGNLVKEIINDPLSEKLVNSITTFCHELGLDVIAQTVESEQIIDCLVPCGFTHAQGLKINQPLPIEHISLS